ncbi:PREDICTED: uncharacterized protein LOC109481768 [Branchiostoma belcheri]|uniref:Uncharacterized protein LOC109481768 n=1 Tax=Branchiostoma belcheri TaxID=7741 RepID=A0A6P5A0R9_BRABE|nr:PREDICTED: uncharacterized protein LOC109481768 [Branchiostoma belcheri]
MPGDGIRAVFEVPRSRESDECAPRHNKLKVRKDGCTWTSTSSLHHLGSFSLPLHGQYILEEEARGVYLFLEQLGTVELVFRAMWKCRHEDPNPRRLVLQYCGYRDCGV